MRELHQNLFKKHLKELERARVLAVSLGESTDVSTKEMLVVYLSFVDEDGVPHVEFFALPRMMGTSAKNIYETIKKLLKLYGLYGKLVALGSDGASVMTGKEKGVGAKLRADIEYLLAMHCVCHKLALGANDAAGLVSFSAEVDKLLRGIGRLVRKSAKRHERFVEIGKIYLGMTRPMNRSSAFTAFDGCHEGRFSARSPECKSARSAIWPRRYPRPRRGGLRTTMRATRKRRTIRTSRASRRRTRRTAPRRSSSASPTSSTSARSSSCRT